MSADEDAAVRRFERRLARSGDAERMGQEWTAAMVAQLRDLYDELVAERAARRGRRGAVASGSSREMWSVELSRDTDGRVDVDVQLERMREAQQLAVRTHHAMLMALPLRLNPWRPVLPLWSLVTRRATARGVRAVTDSHRAMLERARDVDEES